MPLQEDPDGLLTPKDIREIKRVKEDIRVDKEQGTNKVDESIASDCEQLQNKLNKRREELT